MYPVLGMRGGFSLDLDHEENSVMMVGWSRKEGKGGGEVRHNIDSQGVVTDISDASFDTSLDTLDE